MQNLISLELTPQDLADWDEAAATQQRIATKFRTLTSEQRRDINKLGPKSFAFVEQTFDILVNNPQMVPPNLGLTEALADLTALKALRPRLQQLRQLMEKADDTEMALGSDAVAVAYEGYRLLAVSGKSEALKSARRELSQRFSRTRRESDADDGAAE